MPDIVYSESTNARKCEYTSMHDECLILELLYFEKHFEFACLWTPEAGAYIALHKILNLNFISYESSPVLIEAHGERYEIKDWDEAFDKVLELDPEKVDNVQLGLNNRYVAVKQSPAKTSLCCEMRGNLEQLRFLGTALNLTASKPLIQQYSAMHSRLVG